jgi:outer membrane protein TolC
MKRNRNRNIALRALFCTFVLWVPVLEAASERGLGLREVVNEALAKNPKISGAKERINQADAQIPVVRSSVLPTLSLIGSAEERKDSVDSPKVRFGGNIYNNYQTDLRLTQSLFIYGSVAALESAQKERELRKLDREISERELTNSVILAFFEIVLKVRNVETLRRDEGIVKESLVVAEKRSRTGRGQLLDVLQVKTQLALLKTQISESENHVKVAVAKIANLLGDPHSKEVKVKNVLEFPELSYFDKDVKLKEFRLLELEKSRISIAQIDNLKASSLGAHMPSLNANADYYYGSTKQADLFANTSSSWAVGLTLTIPIFSGFSSFYQQQGFNSQRLQLEYERANIENSANLQQVTARKNLETAALGISQGKETLKIATQASGEARRMFRLSVIDLMQFLEVQRSYVEAESMLNKSKFNYLTALVAYFVASGQELNRLVDVLEEGAGK